MDNLYDKCVYYLMFIDYINYRNCTKKKLQCLFKGFKIKILKIKHLNENL